MMEEFTLTCKACGEHFKALTPNFVYCVSCREERIRESKRKSIKKHRSKKQSGTAKRDRNGYVALAAAIVRGQITKYENTLCRYAETGEEKYLNRAKSIESELRTPYYCTLTLGLVDFNQYIVDKRKEYGVDWEDVV